MLDTLCDLAGNALASDSAEACAQQFCNELVGRGAIYFQARHYRLPASRLTAQSHWNAGGFVLRHDPRAWVGRPSSDYVCFACNPLLEPVARRMTLFRFGDFAPHADRRFGAYWDAMSDGGLGEALVAMAYGPRRETVGLHIGFARRQDAAEIAQALPLAALTVANRVLGFGGPDGADDREPELTPRERDVMRYVADGKTDWEIAQIIGVSESTARFHADNARRKLDASNRAHAVARFIALYGLF